MAPKKKPMSDRLSICARTLHQLGNVPVADMMDVNKYPNLSRFSRATLFRHAKKSFDENMYDFCHQSKGRPRLTTKRDLRVKLTYCVRAQGAFLQSINRKVVV